MSVATNATPSLFVHAGVVGWRGRAIVIPGRSMSGKSSLVAALVQAGATYYSDEYAVLDEQGYVHAYPKPLSLRNGMARRPVEGVAEAFDTCAGTAPLPVGLIVMTRYRRGARFRPRVLSAGQAVLALMDNTILARVKPELALSILPRAVSLAHTLSGERGEACKIVEPLMQQLERSNATPVQAVPRPE